MTSPAAQAALERIFGYTKFRGAQETIINRVIEGGNALVLMPTGGGKSLCFQIPALVRQGTGVVVSPLIALMKDQVDALCAAGVRATFINSSLPSGEAGERQSGMVSGEFDIVYVAPERLVTASFLECLDRTQLSLFAIDEAHCVSQWGHDFRPEYRRLDVLQERFADVPRIALTATADVKTRSEIVQHLGLTPEDVFVASFDRPNLMFSVVAKNSMRRQLLDFIRTRHSGESGVVYCMSRKKVEQTVAFLSGEGIDAVAYHAGLDKSVRQRHQDRFLKHEGVVVVATIAFGMGIDKPDVRFVAHLDLPKSIEAYYQEVGRAGRDGLPADAWMCYGYGDAVLIRQMVERSEVTAERKRIQHVKLGALLGYCESATCRRAALLRYFGEEPSGAGCDACDTCLQPVESFDGTVHARKALSNVYRTGQRFGASYLADVLVGGSDERILRNGHGRISTYGIGTELDRNGWISTYRQLIAAGMLVVEPEHGGLSLAERSRALLSGDARFQLRRDATATRAKSGSGGSKDTLKTILASEDQPLFEALRKKRLELAQAQGVPPYVIFHDRTLIEMARDKPRTVEDLSRVSGIGEVKLQKYGDTFLGIVLDSL